MTRTRITIGGVLLGMVAAVVMVALLYAALGPTAAAPQTSSLHVPQAAGAPAATATPAKAPAAPQSADVDSKHYADLLVQNLAQRLGTDAAHVNSAFTAAANDTIDQAVHDGKLDADLAAKVKGMTNQGLGAFVQGGLALGPKGDAPDQGEGQAAVQAIPPALAPLFGMTAAQFADALKGGQTLQSLEQAHNVAHQQVQAAALAAIRSALNAGAQTGKWTQADADKTYQEFSNNIDSVLLKILGGTAPNSGAVKDGSPDAQGSAIQAAGEAVAGLFGMQFDQLATTLRDGQTTLLSLEQAHNVTEQKVADAALAAAQRALTAGVQSGKWSQADADSASQDITQHIYDYLAKFRNAFEMPALIAAAQDAVAPLFGQTTAQLVAALQGGQTLAALEAAHHVTAQQVKDDVTAAAHTRLAAGVQNKEWTQAQADDAALVFQETIDQLLTGNLGAEVKTGK